MAKILVSACLLGCDCTYRGDSNRNAAVLSLCEEHDVIPVCPEQLGGLATPRRPAEIQCGSVINDEGRDVTAAFRKGAEITLKIAELTGAKVALMKANSPSCGSGTVYDGSFSHIKVSGDGIAAGLLKQHEISIFNEEEIPELKKYLINP